MVMNASLCDKKNFLLYHIVEERLQFLVITARINGIKMYLL